MGYPYLLLDQIINFACIREEDLTVLRWGYKHSRELGRRMKSYRGEIIPAHPNFPKGSEAATSDSAKPVDVLAPKINYTAEDDRAIDDYIRQNGTFPVLLALLLRLI